MPTNNHYNKNLKEFANELRNHSTKAEVIIWTVLLKARKTGYRCLRQRPISRFIADFFFPELKLLLEIDGYSHTIEERVINDSERDKELVKLGYKTIRILDQHVFEDLENVQRTIYYELEKRRLELRLPELTRKTRKK